MGKVVVIARVSAGRDEGSVKCSDNKISVNDKTYQLPGYGSDMSTDKLYTTHLKQIIEDGIRTGTNVGVLCVGGGDTDKRLTLGLPSSPGLVALVAGSLFTVVGDNPHFVGVSYLNIHREQLTDILNPADKALKIKTQDRLGTYVENLSEISVKSPKDLIDLYEQGNKFRNILETDLNTPASKSQAIFTISSEWKSTDRVLRSHIQLYEVAGSDYPADSGVGNSPKCLGALLKEAAKNEKPEAFSGCKLTQLMRTVLTEKASHFAVIGHVSKSNKSAAVSGLTLDLLALCSKIDLSPRPNSLDLPQLIEDLRKRVAVTRDAITSATGSNIPKEHIAELDISLSALRAAKRLQWDERERISALTEKERRQTLADRGILEWIVESSGAGSTSPDLILLQQQKDTLLAEYKEARAQVDALKTSLQSSISAHTALAAQPNQSESVLQESLTKIHALRDKLKAGNENLRLLKKSVKEVQDKLKSERSGKSEQAAEAGGNFTLTLMMKRDEIGHLKKDNKVFLEEEKERVQSEAEQDIAEIKLNATQGNHFTLEQIVGLQEREAGQRAQLQHLALSVQCLQAEREKMEEVVEALHNAHNAETETQKARNLLVFRQYKDFFEEEKASTNAKFQDLLSSCVQDCVFLSSKNAELAEENTDLKRKLRHFS